MNKHLTKAKKEKNDEYYTRYEDIEKELKHYIEYNKDTFRGKTILCPCDDWEWSNFTKYFINNFDELKLKKLICTCISSVPFNDPFHIMSDNNDDYYGKIFIKTKDNESIDKLKDNGDFRNKEVTKLKDESDIIVTNPPFSLFREFIDWIGNKEFLSVAPLMSVHYVKEFASLVNNDYHLGYNSISSYIGLDGTVQHIASLWFTTLEPAPIHNFIELTKSYYENKNDYPHYDNYDAIDVKAVNDIPYDYDGVMGVPIRFLQHYNPEQFEILGITQRKNKSELRTKIYNKADAENYNDLNASCVIKIEHGYKILFYKILIKRKK